MSDMNVFQAKHLGIVDSFLSGRTIAATAVRYEISEEETNDTLRAHLSKLKWNDKNDSPQ